ncbi:MAG: hypothetical protein F6K56_25235 [Moorea sp. SIO3G5]|nr:hypothetical protein [Moorena sp. SIO3G5]
MGWGVAVYPEVAENPESAKMSLTIPNYRKLLLPSPHTLTPTPYSLLPCCQKHAI